MEVFGNDGMTNINSNCEFDLILAATAFFHRNFDCPEESMDRKGHSYRFLQNRVGGFGSKG